MLGAAQRGSRSEARPLPVDHLSTNPVCLLQEQGHGVHLPCSLAVGMYRKVCPRSAVCVDYNPCFKHDQIAWLRDLRMPCPVCSQSVTFIQWQVLQVPLRIVVLNAYGRNSVWVYLQCNFCTLPCAASCMVESFRLAVEGPPDVNLLT